MARQHTPEDMLAGWGGDRVGVLATGIALFTQARV
jgi:hypothetical protein